jgi:hypothetical protein
MVPIYYIHFIFFNIFFERTRNSGSMNFIFGPYPDSVLHISRLLNLNIYWFKNPLQVWLQIGSSSISMWIVQNWFFLVSNTPQPIKVTTSINYVPKPKIKKLKKITWSCSRKPCLKGNNHTFLILPHPTPSLPNLLLRKYLLEFAKCYLAPSPPQSQVHTNVGRLLDMTN